MIHRPLGQSEERIVGFFELERATNLKLLLYIYMYIYFRSLIQECFWHFEEI